MTLPKERINVASTPRYLTSHRWDWCSQQLLRSWYAPSWCRLTQVKKAWGHTVTFDVLKASWQLQLPSCIRMDIDRSTDITEYSQSAYWRPWKLQVVSTYGINYDPDDFGFCSLSFWLKRTFTALRRLQKAQTVRQHSSSFCTWSAIQNAAQRSWRVISHAYELWCYSRADIRCESFAIYFAPPAVSYNASTPSKVANRLIHRQTQSGFASGDYYCWLNHTDCTSNGAQNKVPSVGSYFDMVCAGRYFRFRNRGFKILTCDSKAPFLFRYLGVCSISYYGNQHCSAQYFDWVIVRRVPQNSSSLNNDAVLWISSLFCPGTVRAVLIVVWYDRKRARRIGRIFMARNGP